MSDLISRQAAIDAIDKHLRMTDVPVSYPGIVSALTDWLNELPPVQPDSKESSVTQKALDTISRQAAIDAIERNACNTQRTIEAVEALPSAQPEQAIKDCRSCKYGMYNDHYDTCFCYNTEDCSDWDKWESAQPEPTRMVIGKSKGGITLWYQCAKCGEPSDPDDNYCRQCGRKFVDG